MLLPVVSLAALAPGCGGPRTAGYPAVKDDEPRLLEPRPPGGAPPPVVSIPNEEATLRFAWPEEGAAIAAGEPLEARVAVEGLEVFPGGPAVRAALDEGGPITIVDERGRLALGKLAPGEHVLRA